MIASYAPSGKLSVGNGPLLGTASLLRLFVAYMRAPPTTDAAATPTAARTTIGSTSNFFMISRCRAIGVGNASDLNASVFFNGGRRCHVHSWCFRVVNFKRPTATPWLQAILLTAVTNVTCLPLSEKKLHGSKGSNPSFTFRTPAACRGCLPPSPRHCPLHRLKSSLSNTLVALLRRAIMHCKLCPKQVRKRSGMDSRTEVPLAASLRVSCVQWVDSGFHCRRALRRVRISFNQHVKARQPACT